MKLIEKLRERRAGKADRDREAYWRLVDRLAAGDDEDPKAAAKAEALMEAAGYDVEDLQEHVELARELREARAAAVKVDRLQREVEQSSARSAEVLAELEENRRKLERARQQAEAGRNAALQRYQEAVGAKRRAGQLEDSLRALRDPRGAAAVDTGRRRVEQAGVRVRRLEGELVEAEREFASERRPVGGELGAVEEWRERQRKRVDDLRARLEAAREEEARARKSIEAVESVGIGGR